MTPDIVMRDLSLRYGDVTAVDGLTLDLPAGKIYGLLGRNGSGKTSLLSMLASFRRPSAGTLTIGGVDPFENADVMRHTCFIRDSLDVAETNRVDGVLRLAATLRPTWDAAYAARLLEEFQVDTHRRVSALSRGQRSCLGVVLGLASRAPLTILDESYLGMDAVARATFYRELLADYGENPRTVILSTHLIEEAADIVERVVIIDRGRLIEHDESDVLRTRGVTVTGPVAAVEAFTAGRRVIGRRSLGGTLAETLYGPLEPDDHDRARVAGLTLGPVGLQDLFIQLTGDPVDHPSEQEAYR